MQNMLLSFEKKVWTKKSSEIKFRVSMCWKLILKVQQFQSCKYCKVSGANTKPNMASVYSKSRFYLDPSSHFAKKKKKKNFFLTW